MPSKLFIKWSESYDTFIINFVFFTQLLCFIHSLIALMGFAEGEMSERHSQETSVVLRASRLPLVRSALQSVFSAYSGVKGRYPLLGLIGGAAEVGVRSVSTEAMRRATPLLQSLEPQIEVANSLALIGLDRLEKNFPILNQSTNEVMAHLKDALFVAIDDMQMWVVDSMGGALDQLERLAEVAQEALQLLQESQVGRAASIGLDDVLSRLEEATTQYLPLPPTLRREWEMRMQQYEDEDEGDEPGLWTRVRVLLLRLSLLLYHRIVKVGEQLQRNIWILGDAADKMGLLQALELLAFLLQYLQNLLVSLVYRAENLRELVLVGVRSQAAGLAELRLLRQVQQLPVQIQKTLSDLWELSRILLQLVINASPLYGLLQQPSDQQVEDFLNQEVSSSHGSANSLFLKAMDGRIRRRRSLYSLAARTPDLPNDQCSSPKDEEGLVVPSDRVLRRPSAAELIFTPLKQFVTQSQKAFEYLSPNSSTAPDDNPVSTDATATDDC